MKKSEKMKSSLNTQESVNETDKQNFKSEFIGNKEVEGTPFTIIKLENAMFGTLGNHRITEKWEGTMEELEEDLRTITWDRICTVIGVVAEYLNKKNN